MTTVAARHVLLVFAAGALVRLALLRIPRMWYDEATVGIMGLAVLRGEWPIYFHGQPFMGALDAYLAAPVYFALGASPRTLELVAVLVSLGWVALVLRLAWTALGPRATLFAAMLLAVPPDYVLYWAHEGRPVYLLGMGFGTLAILLALGAPGLPGGRAALRFALLGTVLGMAFWTNYLTLVYFPAVAAVLLAGGFRFRHLAPAMAGVPAFVLGSFPHWLYGLPHGTAIPPPGGRIGLADLVVHGRGLLQAAWPLVAGVPIGLRGTPAGDVSGTPLETRLTPAGLALTVALTALYSAAAVGALRLVRRGRPVPRAAMLGLLVLIAVNVGVAVGTRYGRALADDARYLLPVYTALPVVLGAWLASLPVRWAACLLAAVLAVQAVDGLTGSFENLSPAVAAAERDPGRVQQATVRTLEQMGATRLYASDFGTRVMTFLSGERVIFSNHYEEIYPPYVLAVDGAERAGWWLGGRDPTFDANLRALGVTFAYRPVPLGGVYSDFAVAPGGVRELDPTRFAVTADQSPETAGWTVDRDAATVWTSRRPKRGGEWIQVDLGQTEPLALVRWLPGTYQEVPTGVRVEVSRDGAAWDRVVDLPTYVGPLYWSAGRPMGRVRAGRVEVRVPGTLARFIRITQTGANRIWPWTMRELFVYAADPDPGAAAAAPDGATLARTLRAAGVVRLYADHGWGSRAAVALPGLRIMPANLALDAYNFKGSRRDLLPPARWTAGAAVLLEPGDADGFRAFARRSGLGFAEQGIGPLRLFTYAAAPPRPGAPLPRSALRSAASREPAHAGRAVDGDPETRWGTAGPQASGDFLQVDIRPPRVVRAVRLWSRYLTDYPRGLSVAVSEDGVSWRPVAAETSTEGPLRWGGVAMLHEGVQAVRLDFAAARASALRLSLTRGDPTFDWSVHELTVYAAE